VCRRSRSARASHNIHTLEEYVDLPGFYQGCLMALALADVGD